MDEIVALEAEKVFRWEGPKRKQTLFKAKLGRLVLTDQRLLFLSTGKNDVNFGRLAGGAVSPVAGLRTGKTSHLDLDATLTAGGLDVPVGQLRTAALNGMFKVLTIRWVDGSGAEQVSTFAPKNGGMPNGPAWVAAIDAARSGA